MATKITMNAHQRDIQLTEMLNILLQLWYMPLKSFATITWALFYIIVFNVKYSTAIRYL